MRRQEGCNAAMACATKAMSMVQWERAWMILRGVYTDTGASRTQASERKKHDTLFTPKAAQDLDIRYV